LQFVFALKVFFADTNTDTFTQSIGDTFTPVLLPALLMLLVAI